MAASRGSTRAVRLWAKAATQLAAVGSEMGEIDRIRIAPLLAALRADLEREPIQRSLG